MIKIVFIIKESKKYNPDLILASGKHSVWFGSLLKIFFRLKFICFAHGSEFGTTNKREININKLSYSYSDLIISVSNYTMKYIYENTNIKPKKIVVINNGANNKQFFKLGPEDIKNFKIKNKLLNKKIILTLGNISERKGQWVTIKALQYVIKKIPNICYICVGLPSEIENCIKLAKETGVKDHVIFTGIVEDKDLNKWLNIADIFVMTSTHTKKGDFEGFGIAVIEAALCGKPAIVSKGNNGVFESISDSITGLSVKEKNSKDVANKILSLFEDESKIKRMGENALIRARKHFTWEKKVKEMYEEIISL